MPIFRYYDENQKLIEERQEPLIESNFPRSLEKLGSERMAGYMECFMDFMKEIDPILFQYHYDQRYQKSSYKVHKEVTRLFEEKEDFINFPVVQEFIKSQIEKDKPQP